MIKNLTFRKHRFYFKISPSQRQKLKLLFNVSEGILIGSALSSLAAFSQEERISNPFSLKWENGFKLTSQDNQFALGFGARVMVDKGYFFQNDELDSNFGSQISKSGTEFRRARLFISGTVYSNVEFKFQLDFARCDVAFKIQLQG